MVFEFGIVGERHRKLGIEKQDNTVYKENSRYVVIVLSDGVSTCSKSFDGARIASNSAADILFEKADYFMEFNPLEVKDYVLSHVLYELSKSKDESIDISEYSSTLAAVLYDKKEERLLCFNLGDSLIVGSGFGEVKLLSVPSDSTLGCPVTTTKGATDFTEVSFMNSRYERITIFSDGAWREIISRDRIDSEFQELLLVGDYKKMGDFIVGKTPSDDSSFISMELL